MVLLKKILQVCLSSQEKKKKRAKKEGNEKERKGEQQAVIKVGIDPSIVF